MSFILSLAVRGRLSTRDRIHKYDPRAVTTCVLCNSNLESHAHLFFECLFSRAIWTQLLNYWLLIVTVLATNLKYFLCQAFELSFSPQLGPLWEANSLSNGVMANKVNDLLTLKAFGLVGRPPKAPCIIPGLWSHLLPGWLKVNTDGASLGAPGDGGCRGVDL
ncbi:hypothetical protein Dsin_032159 [Dipteronia sinensis]|uniref:Reverse transcriptase zinc-binding domain-containing protein n=1 Tax=Dipteronia sinensis TaxID=43782 RepID=A0AAD9ZNA1_9ROSI|nr:hypothetical protein Dsin_032159 [Dipteronia sinensis]